ncbi:class I SAM-dependent methyltransferase [Nocardia asiatica]|uniref:class I SAM-dependent methyltransferase n=1 Tax=Nocardia asiatica TaxID=209252 RepID=UPI00031306AD|nr:SAM-dependent methyltransferase [Nocardia asiatica]
MQVGRRSRTALAVAHARAYHQIADEPRIFTDPLALRILGEPVLSASDFDHGLDQNLVRHRRLFIAARSRCADDTVAATIARGTRQVVILGAGLDTTAYRNTSADVRFFEVDHPVTQEWKRHRLSEAGIPIPASLAFVPIDFEQSTLAAGLADAGLDRTRSALFVWLGVAAYLTRTSVYDTLRYIAGHSATSEVVFDYFYPLASTPHDPTAAQLQARADRVAAAGEPWLSFFTAPEIRKVLQSLGYPRVEDRSAAKLLETYGIRPAVHPTSAGPHLVYASTT